jgi:hypothetical protein
LFFGILARCDVCRSEIAHDWLLQKDIEKLFHYVIEDRYRK